MSSGGVRNLRAMFEQSSNSNSASAPSPERGRSPAGFYGAGSNGTSPRPLSKVRTSFVTVEKGGQMGIRRDMSGEPSMAKRRDSFSIDEVEDKKEVEERKQSLTKEMQLRRNSVAITDVIPEVAIETEDELQEETRGREPARIMEKSTLNKQNGTTPRSQLTVVESKSSPQKIKEEKAVSPSKSSVMPPPIEPSPKKQHDSHPISPKKSPVKPAVEQPKTKEPSQLVAPKASSSTLARVPAKSPSKPTPAPFSTIETTTTPARLSPQKQPQKPKTPISKTFTNPHSTNTITTQSQKKPTSEAKATPEKKAPQALKTGIGASPPQQHFSKPKPRSPTRPVRLPASLTAHTASSGSKTATASSTTSHPVRSQSQASAASSTKTLQRKPSTLNKATSSRPSLGPPPVKEVKKEPTRTSLPGGSAGDDFLARMMRPTASSASKTAHVKETGKEHERTPPKKVLPKVKQAVDKVVAKVERKVEEKKVDQIEAPKVETRPSEKEETVKAAAPVVAQPNEVAPQTQVLQQESTKPEAHETVPANQEDLASEPGAKVELAAIESANGETGNSDAEILDAEQANLGSQPVIEQKEKDAAIEGEAMPITAV